MKHRLVNVTIFNITILSITAFKITIIGSLLLLALLASPLVAQSGGDFEIVRATIDGGGSTERSPEPILLRGTIGQPDAGASYKGIYYLKSGFWSSQERLGIFFIDGFESGDTSAWSSVAGAAFTASPPASASTESPPASKRATPAPEPATWQTGPSEPGAN